jgi:hypothetical protein
MSVRNVVIGLVLGGLSLSTARGWAATKDAAKATAATKGAAKGATKDAVKRIEDLNEKALASYKAGDAEGARTQLMEAVVFGKESDLDIHPVMAKTYLNLALIHTEGLADEEKGKRYLSLARRINPKIEVPPELADADAPKGVVAEAMAEKEKKDAVAAIADASDARKKEKAAAVEAQAAKDREKVASLEAESAKQREKAAAGEALESKQKEKRSLEERDRLTKELSSTKDSEKQQRQAKEILEKQKAEVEKLLAQAKDSEKKEREAKEQLQKTKADTDKQLADLKDSAKKERESREKLEKELAATKEREAKEKTAREALEGEKKALEAREKESREHDAQMKQARERLADGPDLPAQIPQALYCPLGDEAQRDTELFIHCAPQPNVKAKGVALYYRTSGSFHFNSLAMERSKRGWFVAAVPAPNVTGKVLQYYAEATDGRGDVVAANGKANSPNIVTLRSAGTVLSNQVPSAVGKRSLTKAHAVVPKPARPHTSKKDPAKSP